MLQSHLKTHNTPQTLPTILMSVNKNPQSKSKPWWSSNPPKPNLGCRVARGSLPRPAALLPRAGRRRASVRAVHTAARPRFCGGTEPPRVSGAAARLFEKGTPFGLKVVFSSSFFSEGGGGTLFCERARKPRWPECVYLEGTPFVGGRFYLKKYREKEDRRK